MGKSKIHNHIYWFKTVWYLKAWLSKWVLHNWTDVFLLKQTQVVSGRKSLFAVYEQEKYHAVKTFRHLKKWNGIYVALFYSYSRPYKGLYWICTVLCLLYTYGWMHLEVCVGGCGCVLRCRTINSLIFDNLLNFPGREGF